MKPMLATFNIQGDSTLACLTPQFVWEYALGKDLRGLVVRDERTGGAIVFVYKAFDNGPKSFVLGRKPGQVDAKAWLLRGRDGQGVDEKQAMSFLKDADSSHLGFALTGRVQITLEGGHMKQLDLTDIATVDKVPPDKAAVSSQIEFWKDQAEELKKQLAARPDDQLLKWGIQQAEDGIRFSQRVVQAGPQYPATVTDGRIVAEWNRAKPLLQLTLP